MERTDDKLIQLHRKLDEISFAMFESLRLLPDEPREFHFGWASCVSSCLQALVLTHIQQ